MGVTIDLGPITEARRNLVTARTILRMAQATAEVNRDPALRADAEAHVARLRVMIPELIEACHPCPTCGKGQTYETLTTGSDQPAGTQPDLAEVWCSRCDQPATCERVVTNGVEAYRAAYCGTCATNVGWSGKARASRERRAAGR